jgi:hypothetical protein
VTSFSGRRPHGLRLAPASRTWWRIDHDPPAAWDWAPFSSPRGRFDPLSGRFRVRYAANRPAVAARERFPTKTIAETDGDLWLVKVTGLPPALHLTRQATLDALGLDDRISTRRTDLDRDDDPLLDTCGRLMDAVHDWWAGSPPPLVYRARTVPTGRSVAFTATSAPVLVAAGQLRDAAALHAHLVLVAGFTVPGRWLR